MGLQEDKERVREASDIVDIVSKVVALKPSGKNYKGLCPFHREKTPSFYVDPDRQRYHCFGCQADGDAFEFLMKIDGLSFPEALATLAQQAHITLTTSTAHQDNNNDQQRRQLLEVIQWAAERFQTALHRQGIGDPARAYLENRGIEEALITRFQLGYAPPGRENILKAAQRDHYSPELLEAAGLILRREGQAQPYDRFRNRVMFPIHDVRGRVIAFGGRVIGQGEPKYLNSPETEIYHKGDHLFGLHLAKSQARKEKRLVLVEGYLDVIACHKAGVTETVGCLGTALTPAQAKLLKRYAQEIIILYDTDAAGLKAAVRAFELINQENLKIKALALTQGKDPDEVVRQFGAAALKNALGQAVHFVEFMLEQACRRYNPGSIEGKIRIKDEVIAIIVQLEDKLEQHEYSKRLATRLGQPAEIIVDEVKKAAGKHKSSRPAAAPMVADTPPVVQEERSSLPEGKIPREERVLLNILLRFPAQIELVKKSLDLDVISADQHRRLLQAMFEEPAADPDGEEEWLPTFLENEHVPLPLRAYARELAKEDKGEEEPWPVISDCLKRLVTAKLKTEQARLQEQIQQAATAGDMETLKQLEEQKFNLAKQMKQIGMTWR